MIGEIQTFTFEGNYSDDDGGSRCDVVNAYSREQALALAGMAMTFDNEWAGDPDRFERFAGFAEFYEDQVKIQAEWTDLNGTACPNCTAHNGAHVGGFSNGLALNECTVCGYQWAPLGKSKEFTCPASEEIDLQISNTWKVLTEGEDACRTEGCGEDPSNGEGYDGFCGNCADKKEQTE